MSLYIRDYDAKKVAEAVRALVAAELAAIVAGRVVNGEDSPQQVAADDAQYDLQSALSQAGIGGEL